MCSLYEHLWEEERQKCLDAEEIILYLEERLEKSASTCGLYELLLEEERKKCLDAEEIIAYLEERLEQLQQQMETEQVASEKQSFHASQQIISCLEKQLETEKKHNTGLQQQLYNLSGRYLEGLPMHALLMLNHKLTDAQKRLSFQLARAAVGVSISKWQWQCEDGTFQDFDCATSLQIEHHAAGGASDQSKVLEVINQGKRLRIDFETLEQELVGAHGKRRRIRRADEITLREPSWVPQSNEAELVPVEVGTSDYAKVLNTAFGRFRGSLSSLSCALISVQRVQNTFLWRKFEAERQNLIKVRGVDGVSERMLFHGTRARSPFEIVLKREGFMLDHARDGLYGKGLYFAALPHYSHEYAHHTQTRTDQVEYHLLMCRVLCGKSRCMGTDIDKTMTRLKLPPWDYDSIEGGPHRPHRAGPGAKSSHMHVVYHDTQVYPEFIITYKQASEQFYPDVPAEAV